MRRTGDPRSGTATRTLGPVLGVAALVAVVGLLATAAPTAADHGGDQLIVGDSADAEYDTIQAAIDDAQHEDTILVEDGTYEESLSVPVDGLTIRAADGQASPVVDAEAQAPFTVEVRAGNVTLEDLTIQNTGLSDYGGGIRAREAPGFTLQGSTVEGNLFDDQSPSENQAGVRLHPKAGAGYQIGGPSPDDANTFTRWDHAGVAADAADPGRIEGNTFTEISRSAVKAGADASPTIVDNTFETNGVRAISLSGTQSAVVSENSIRLHLLETTEIEGEGSGVWVHDGAQDTRIEANEFQGQAAAAVEVSGCSEDACDTADLKLRENVFSATNTAALALNANTEGLAVDARANDWGVYEEELLDARVADNGDGNEVLQVPFLLEDGSAEPGLPYIVETGEEFLSVQAAVDAADSGQTVKLPGSADAQDPTPYYEAVAVGTSPLFLEEGEGTALLASEEAPVVDAQADMVHLLDVDVRYDGDVDETVVAVDAAGMGTMVSDARIELPARGCSPQDACSGPQTIGVRASAAATVADTVVETRPDGAAEAGTVAVDSVTDEPVLVDGLDASGFTIGVAARAPDTIVKDSTLRVDFTGVQLAADGAEVRNTTFDLANSAVYLTGPASLEHDEVLLRQNDFGAVNAGVLVNAAKDTVDVDARLNDWGALREEVIHATKVENAGDREVAVVPYLDEAGDPHPPKPKVSCYQKVDGAVEETLVAETISFQAAMEVDLPDDCLTIEGDDEPRRFVELGEDLEEYRGATVDSLTTVRSDATEATRTATDGVLAGGASVQSRSGAPAMEFVDGSEDSYVRGVSIQGEPIGADGIVVETDDITIEDARVGVREHPASTGLVATDVEGLEVRSSVFLSGQPALRLDGTSGTAITNASIALSPTSLDEPDRPARAVYASGASGTEVVDSVIHGAQTPNSQAIAMEDVEAPTVAGNLVEGAVVGIYLDGSTSATVEDNNVLVPTASLTSSTYGVSIFEGADHDLERNFVVGADTGLSISGAPGVEANQTQLDAVQTGVQVKQLTSDDESTDLELHNARLAVTSAPLVLGEDTQGLVVDAECNDWGAYQADLIEARIQDDGEDNTVDYTPWTSATVDDGRDCLTPPEADFSPQEVDVTREDTTDFVTESEPGDRPIVEYRWDFGDNTTATGETVSHSYSEVGDFPIVHEVEDTEGMVAKATGDAIVRNLAPSLNELEDVSTHHSDTITVPIDADDPEDDSIELSAWEDGTSPKRLPAAISLDDEGEDDGSGRLVVSAEPDEFGSFPLTVRADDGQPRNNLDNQTLEVTVVNAAPVFTTAPQSADAAVNRTLELEIAAEEQDADELDALSADLSALPANHTATFETDEGGDGVPNEGTLTWTPEDGDQGTYDIEFVAEGPGRTTTLSTTLEVVDEVPPPTFSTSAPAEAPEGTEITAEATASPDADALEDPVEWDVEAVAVYEPAVPGDDPFEATLPGTVQVDGNTANWTGTLWRGADRVNVTFTADDGYGPANTTTSTEVQLKPDLDAQQPVETRTGIQTARPILGEDLEFRAGAMDEDGTIQTATVRPADDASALDLTDEDGDDVYTAELNGTDLADAYPEAGGYTATYRVVDDDGLETVQVLEISVEEALAPEVDTTFTEIVEEAEGPHGYTADLRGDAADPNGRSLDELTIEWVAVGTPDGTMPVGDASLRTSADLPVGDYTLELRVTDPYGETGVAAIDVAIDDFVTAEAFLVGEDERFEDGTYRYSALDHALEDLRGWVTVENDQLKPVTGAEVDVTATYQGPRGDLDGITYAEEAVTTPANGTAEFSFEQLVAGVADGPSVASLPGQHQITLEAEADSRPAAPDAPAPELDDVTLDVWIGPAVLAPSGG
jgi:nitrous oxidase accessory protein NosD